jgi:methylenetetrahydrofolate reductase (NADPH)
VEFSRRHPTRAITTATDEFRYAADLVALVRADFGDWFRIDVAAYPETHPQARSPEEDVRNFVRKVQAGADSAITQYFYNDDAYLRFVDEAARLGCTVPIVPGIMPITNFTQLARFSDNCGAEIPRWIRRRLESFGDDRESIRAFGADVVAEPVPAAAGARGPRTALLHDEPGCAYTGDLAPRRLARAHA